MYCSTINMKIDLQLHEFCSVIVKVTIKKQQEHTLLVWNIINKNMGLVPKLESNGSENNQKSEVTGTRVNLPRIKTYYRLILLVYVISSMNFWSLAFETRVRFWYGSIKPMIWNNRMYIHIYSKIQGSPWHKKHNFILPHFMFNHGSYS